MKNHDKIYEKINEKKKEDDLSEINQSSSGKSSSSNDL